MADNMDLPEDLLGRVEEIGPPLLTAEQLEVHRGFTEVRDRSAKIREVLSAWSEQQREERTLRRRYANWLIGILSVEIVAIMVAFFLIGLGRMEVDQWVASTFIVAVFAEVAGLALIVVKYLFPPTGREVLDLIERL
jgi:type VI protein secretion system component VasF